MAIARYLAMTADEFAAVGKIPPRVAWMACHFSPYSTSLANLPDNLPAGSLLILNDSTPPSFQSPKIIAKELEYVLKKWNCCGLLLDFQREDCAESLAIIKESLRLKFPVCVSEIYAKDLDCPVFLPPLPLTIPLQEYIKPWKSREIWLDITRNCEKITVTEKENRIDFLSSALDCPLADQQLHCHYKIEKTPNSFVFTLHRTNEDLNDLLCEAEELGIRTAVGLYQELK